MAVVGRIVARTILVALLLTLLQLMTERFGWDVPHLRERLDLISAGYFMVFAGTLISSSHRRPLLAAALIIAPIAWENAWNLSTAARWLTPGIAGLVIGTLLQYLVMERNLWPTSTNDNKPTDASPTPRPERTTPPRSADNPSPSTRQDDTSSPSRAISPRGTDRYDQRTPRN
ncbi:MAG: hypothetical protein ABI885_26530 [Gammaproteobacteria bacterium]